MLRDLVDVAGPCETGDNLEVLLDCKKEQYSAIRAKLEERGYEALLNGFISGTLHCLSLPFYSFKFAVFF